VWEGDFRQIFPDGTRTPVLGYGAMELRGLPHRRPRPLDPQIAKTILNTALDLGITFIDTSIDYGLSEELIGEGISHRRGEFLLASKAGCPLHDDAEVDENGSFIHDYSRHNIRAGIEQSLRRLRTDHLDLLQLHISPSRSVIGKDGVIETLQDLKAEGKTRWIGISSTLPNLVDHIDLGVFDVFQLSYSALERQNERYLPLIREKGAGTIVRGGTSQGGRKAKPDAGGRKRSAEELDFDDLRGAESLSEFLLRFVITNPHVSTVIVGTASLEHLRTNVAAAIAGPLPADIFQEAQQRLSQWGFGTPPG